MDASVRDPEESLEGGAIDHDIAVHQLAVVDLQVLHNADLVSAVGGVVHRVVGYDDVVAFRKLFARWTGLTPSDCRARYGPRAAPELVLELGRAPAGSNSLAGARSDFRL
jgi:hypothetical protein